MEVWKSNKEALGLSLSILKTVKTPTTLVKLSVQAKMLCPAYKDPQETLQLNLFTAIISSISFKRLVARIHCL